MKKLLCVLLCVFMLAGAVPVFASAAQTESQIAGAKTSEQPTGRGTVDLSTVYSGSARSGARAASNTEAAKTAIIKALTNHADMVDIESYNIPVASMNSLFQDVYYGNPQFFYMDNNIKYNYYPDTMMVANVYLYYIIDQSDMTQETKKFNDAANALLDGAKNLKSDLEKLLYINDYIALNCRYDMDVYNEAGCVPSSYNAYGCLVKKLAVCQGYALAYKYLANLLGIECVLVPSDSMNHVWNMVKLNNKWYHVDTTWNDPVPDSLGYVSHTYFLKSDIAMTAGPAPHTGWVSPYKATDSAYNGYFWNSVTSAVLPFDGSFYYTTSDKKLMKRDMQNGKTAELPFLADTWKVWGSGSSTWSENYAKIAVSGGLIYFNTSKAIYAVKPDGSSYHAVYTPDTSKGYIYGIAFQNGKLAYSLKQAPDDNDKIYFTDIKFEENKTEVTPFAKGDPTGDGYIKLDDALLTQKMIVRLLDLDEKQMSAADTNGDGEVNVRDVVLMQKKIAGIISAFPAA